MNFTPELIAAAKTADSPESLIAIAKDHGITLSDSEAALYFRQLLPPTGELSDDDLDDVSGGGCGGSSTPDYYCWCNSFYTPGCRVIAAGNAGCASFPGSGCTDGGSPDAVFDYANGGYTDWYVTCQKCKQVIYRGSGRPWMASREWFPY